MEEQNRTCAEGIDRRVGPCLEELARLALLFVYFIFSFGGREQRWRADVEGLENEWGRVRGVKLSKSQ